MVRYPTEWSRWTDLSELERRSAVFSTGFWEHLSEEQRTAFLRDADWQEIRHVPEARQAKLDGLVSMDQICEHLGLTPVKVYWVMSTRKLRGWLIDGEWKFDKSEVDRWVEERGGIEAVRQDVDAQIEEHRKGQLGNKSS